MLIMSEEDDLLLVVLYYKVLNQNNIDNIVFEENKIKTIRQLVETPAAQSEKKSVTKNIQDVFRLKITHSYVFFPKPAHNLHSIVVSTYNKKRPQMFFKSLNI